MPEILTQIGVSLATVALTLWATRFFKNANKGQETLYTYEIRKEFEKETGELRSKINRNDRDRQRFETEINNRVTQLETRHEDTRERITDFKQELDEIRKQLDDLPGKIISLLRDAERGPK